MKISYLEKKKNEIRVKIREYLNKYLSKIRRERLNNTDFTIISNNCWAGHVYRYFGLPYNTPTIGLYIWASDFLVFCQFLRQYLSADLEFINVEESKYRDEIIQRGHQNKPLGRIIVNNMPVEIVFLHYSSKAEAYEKWKRRVKRVNYSNLIIKDSYQNGFTSDMIPLFEALPYKKKICFVHLRKFEGKNRPYFHGYEKCDELLNDTLDFRKYVNLKEMINK